MRARLLAVLAACFLVFLTTAGAHAATPGTGVPATAPPGATPSAAQAGEAEEPAGEVLRGTLTGPDREPVPDVDVTVVQDGEEVGTATTDAEGVWEVELPGPGGYTVSLDVNTLPEGLQPRNAGGETLPDVPVTPGQTRTVLFPLTAGDQAPQESPQPGGTPTQLDPDTDPGDTGGTVPTPAGGSSFLDRFLQLTVEGVKLGAIIAITALGLSLVFGTTRLINFAHGEFVTVGAVAAFFFSTAPGSLPLVLAAVLAMVVGAVLAGGLELGLWRPMRRRGTGLIQLFIISIGLSLLLRYLVLAVFGSRRDQYDQYALQPAMELGPVRITPRDLIVTLLSFLILLAVAVMLQRTRIGKGMRAVSDNKDLAEASGIDVDRVILVVWLLGGGLAALGGVFYGLTQAVYWDMGFYLLLLMFAGVILGGLGSAYGAMLGGLVIGLVSQWSTLWFQPSLQNAWALLVLILVLLLRPQGILGRPERAG